MSFWKFRILMSILMGAISNSFGQKQVVVIGLGILVLCIIPNFDSAFAGVISVGDAPIDVHLAESLNLLFVTNQISNSVSIIDTTTNTVINTVPVGDNPFESVFVASTSLLYVTNQASNDVSVVDVTNPLTASVIATIPVQTFAFNIDYNSNNKQIYVTNSISNSVSVIDADSTSGNFNTVVKTIPVGAFPTGLRVNEVTNKIYIGNLISNGVSVIDGNTDTVITTIDVFSPGAVGVDENNNRVFISNAFARGLTVIDSATDNVITAVQTGDSPRESAYDPNQDQILVVNNDSGTISVFDGTSYAPLGEIPVSPSPFGLDISSTNVIYIASTEIDSVTIIDLLSNVPPVAKAGENQAAFEGEIVELDGSASSDFNGDPIIFKWSQTQGPNVVLSSLSDVKPTFTAPNVDFNTLLEFQLIVNDGVFDSIPDFVSVAIKNPSTFEVPLNFVGGQLEGDIVLDKFPENTQITFDFINPDGVTEGKLEDAKLTSNISGENVEFEFVANIEEPDNVPPLLDPALYFEIENTVIDFSNPNNFPSNNPPLSQFLVSKDYNAGRIHSDGCPVVDVILLNEDVEEPFWESYETPQISNTNTIYALNRIDHQVHVIDGNTNNVVTSIDTGQVPAEAVFVQSLNKLYVANANSGTIDVIDTTTNTVQKTIPFFGANTITYDKTTEKVYVTSFGPGDVAVIDVVTDTIIDLIDTPGTTLNNIQVSSSLQRLYVVDIAVNAVFVIDIPSKFTIGYIPLDGVPAGLLINPENNLLYIALFTSNKVTVVDGVTNTLVTNIPVGAGPAGFGLNSITNKLYVANSASGTVSVIDASINAVIDTIDLLPSILNISVNENTDRLYVTNQFFGTISVLDGSKHELLDTISTPPGIFGIEINDSVSNPVRDPSNDVRDSGTNEILECAYIAKLPHLSKFAVGGIVGLNANFLGGAGGGTGAPSSTLNTLSSNTNYYIPPEIENIIDNFDSALPLSPMNPDLFENFDFPLTITHTSSNGYPLVGFENTIVPNVIKVGTPVTIDLIFLEDDDIQHFSFYTGLYGSKSNPSDSNIQILYNKDRELEIFDPFESLTDVNVTKTDLGDSKIKMTVFFTPTKEDSIKDLIIRTWDPNLSSWDVIIRNAFDIVFDVDDNSSPSNYSEPIILEIKSSTIPIWIKNNAAWWSDQQISDDDFVAGIEYLIKNKIINVPTVEVGAISTTTEIPDWIQNNAGWWAESLITDDDFIEAMQWLISNGVIQI